MYVKNLKFKAIAHLHDVHATSLQLIAVSREEIVGHAISSTIKYILSCAACFSLNNDTHASIHDRPIVSIKRLVLN